VDEFALSVKVWWAMMSLLGLFNIGLWMYVYGLIKDSEAREGAELARYRKWQWIFCGLYVFGCASRSVVLRGDVARITMIDHWFASVLVGRTIATIAEVAFVAQWALLLLLLAKRVELKPVATIGWALVPLIGIAEIFSWWASLTTNHLGNVIEESLWAFDAMLMVLAFTLCYNRVSTQVQRFFQVGILAAVAYVIFMVAIDIPTYVSRWQASALAGKQYLSVTEGFVDIQRYTVTGSFEAWRYNMVWMSLYFSVAVWISMILVVLPRFGGHPKEELGE
jgi:hypothetical protein